MIDIEELKRKALAAGGERWTADGGVVWFESGDGAVTAAALTHCDDSAYPPVLDDDIAAHVAACNPATILALIERLEAVERDGDARWQQGWNECSELREVQIAEAEVDALKYRALLASATGKPENLRRLLSDEAAEHYVDQHDIEAAEPSPGVQIAAHVMVSERHGKFDLIHLVAYLLDAAIAKGKA